MAHAGEMARRTPYMDHDEAWLYAMEEAAGSRGSWRRRHIEACLNECSGNAKAAVALSRQLHPGSEDIWLNDFGELGHRGLRIDSNMHDRNLGLDVWTHEHWKPGHPQPDIHISWEDVFTWVRDGAQQLCLF